MKKWSSIVAFVSIAVCSRRFFILYGKGELPSIVFLFYFVIEPLRFYLELFTDPLILFLLTIMDSEFFDYLLCSIGSAFLNMLLIFILIFSVKELL